MCYTAPLDPAFCGVNRMVPFARRFLSLASIAAIVFCTVTPCEAAERSKLAFVGPDGKLQYAADADGDTIPDFSNCGYMGGGVAFPDVPAKATLKPETDAKDDTPRIQQAIDAVARMPADEKGLRGAVLL